MLFYVKGKNMKQLVLNAKGFKGKQAYDVVYFKATPREIYIEGNTYIAKDLTYEEVVKKLGKICEKDEEE